jgi:ribonucleoside-diphosphate reductase beta chain
MNSTAANAAKPTRVLVDAHSGQVWATLPAVAVDGESWTLALWYLHEQGVVCTGSVSDGGKAIHEALQTTKAISSHQRDVWHLLHLAGQVQARLERVVQEEEDRQQVIERQERELANLGRRPAGRPVKTTRHEHEQWLIQLHRLRDAVCYLFAQLRELLEVVVLTGKKEPQVLGYQARRSEVQTVLDLLEEAIQSVPTTLQKEVQRVIKQVRLALPALLYFAQEVEAAQHEAIEQLGEPAVGLVAWAWQRCSDGEKQTLLLLSSIFQAGEESVTLDLLPLIMVVAQDGYLEEEMYLTTFLWEEAKHTEFFRRYLDEVAQEHGDLHQYHTPSYRRIFYEELPQTMHALLTDPSPKAQLQASITYNMIVEGVLAETGYRAYFNMLDRNNIMPGLKQGIRLIKQDESRHLAYGVFLISRLVAQNKSLWPFVEQQMNTLLVPAYGVVTELFEGSEGREDLPFGLRMEEYLNYATVQFSKRFARIERAREQTLEQLYQIADVEVAEEK